MELTKDALASQIVSRLKILALAEFLITRNIVRYIRALTSLHRRYELYRRMISARLVKSARNVSKHDLLNQRVETSRGEK